MPFFGLTSINAMPSLKILKLDINFWTLPGVFGQQVHFVDVGVKLRLINAVTPNEQVSFGLTVPFSKKASDGPTDLVPSLRDDEEVANLVFGTAGNKLTQVNHSWSFNDDESTFLFADMDGAGTGELGHAEQAGRPPIAVTAWRIALKKKAYAADQELYSRVRFVVDNPSRLWNWQKAERRRSHAILDLRVQEFRALQGGTNMPDYANEALEIDKVNVFTIMSARYKAGRVNPGPRYVRVLEGAGWNREYLGRKMSTRREDFIVTFWQKDAVGRNKPMRSFLEIERRRPTALRSSIVGALIVIAAWALFSPVNQVSTSIAGHIWSHWAPIVIPVIGLSALLGVWKVALNLSKSVVWLKKAKAWWLRRKYRIR